MAPNNRGLVSRDMEILRKHQRENARDKGQNDRHEEPFGGLGSSLDGAEERILELQDTSL